VHLKDQAGAPVTGIPVKITGRTTLTKTTDAGGCAVFASVPAGNYTASMDQAGWVDENSVQAVSLPTPIKAGETQEVEQIYARAASVTVVSFKGSDGVTLAWNRASVGGGSLTAPRLLTGAVPLGTGKTLFPLTTGNYVVWAGGCADPGTGNNTPATPLAAPGGDVPVNLIVPTLNIHAANQAPGTPRVTVKPLDPACPDTFTVPAPTPPSAGNGNQWVWPIRLPIGRYSVCAELSGSKTSTPFTFSNLSKTGTDVPMSLTGTSPAFTGVTANDGTGPQNRTITAGTCP